MNKKVLVTAAAAALLVIAAPQPAAKAMTGIIPAIDQDSTNVVQVGGGRRGIRGGGRGSGGGRGGGEWLPRGPAIGSFRAFGGDRGGFLAPRPSPRIYGWSNGGSRSFGKPYIGGHRFRDNGVGRHVFRSDRPRGFARGFDGRKFFDGRKAVTDRKLFNHRKFDDGKFGFRKFDGDRKFDHRKFAHRKFDDDKFFHKRRHRALFFVAPLFAYDYGFNGYGCEWLRWKAIQTGSPYWWRRYEWCRNGWGWW
jgi:hypothetical protein